MIAIIDVYHGTINEYAINILECGIDLSKSNEKVDFGPGFYVTSNKDFAIARAEQLSCLYSNPKYYRWNPEFDTTGAVVVFELNLNKMESLNHMDFHDPDEDWARFVLVNRSDSHIKEQYSYLLKDYDVVHGPTADGKGLISNKIKEINSGITSIDNFDYSKINPSQNNIWGDQYSFHTTAAISCLNIKDIIAKKEQT